MFNPPFVRHLALADTTVSSQNDRIWSRLGVAAVGDGTVAFFDVEPDASPSGSTSGSRGSTKKGSKVTSHADPLTDESTVCPPLSKLMPGLQLSLDHTNRGHTAAASCCCFLSGSLELVRSGDTEIKDSWRDEMLLASAGDDKKVLIWSVPRAVAFSWHRRQKQQQSTDTPYPVLPAEDDTQQCGIYSSVANNPLVAQLEHRRKVNSICSSSDLSIEGNRLLYVADTGKLITCIRC